MWTSRRAHAQLARRPVADSHREGCDGESRLVQELMDHLRESADITLPALSPIPEEAGTVEAALAQAQLPFVGSSAEALALTADRKR